MKTRKNEIFLFFLFSFLVGSSAMFFMLLLSGRIFSKENILLTGDALKLVANLRMLSRSILHGQNPWYSYATSMGMNTSLIIAYDFMSPFNILFLLFPNVDPNSLIAIIYILKTGLSAAAFYLFAVKGLKINNFPAVLFSGFYSMCAFGIFHALLNNMWGDALYMLPLVFLAILYAIRSNKFYPLILAYSGAFVTNFYTGYMIGVFSFLFFFLCLLIEKKELEVKDKTIKTVKYFATVLISVLISSVIWMPTLYCILHYSGSDSSSFLKMSTSVIELLYSMFWGRADVDAVKPFVYCGTLSFILLPVFFFHKKINMKHKITAGILLLFCILCFLVLPFYKLIHAFDSPIGFDFRFSFCFSFFICCLGGMVLDRISEIPVKVIAICGVISLAVLTAGYLYTNMKSGDESLVLVVISAFLILVWTGIIVFARKKKVSILYVISISVMLLEVVANGYLQWSKLVPVQKQTYDTWKFYTDGMMQDLKSENAENDLYRVYLQNDFLDNSDSFCGYKGITDFGTADNPVLRLTMQKLGLYSSVHMLHATGITPVTEMLLGVKYRYIGDNPYDINGIPHNLRKEDLSDSSYISTGFMVNPEFVDLTMDGTNSFENMNKLVESMSGTKMVFSPVDEAAIEVREEGLNWISNKDGQIFKKNDEYDSSAITFLVNDGNISDKYLQVVFLNPGYYNDIYYVMFGMENLMNQEENLSDQIITGSPAAKMSKTEYGDCIIIANYSDEDLQIPFDDIVVYEFHEDKFIDSVNRLSGEPFIVDECKNGNIKGHVLVNSGRNNLFISVPYIDGWKAYINGEETNIIPAMNETFISLMIPGNGEYEIELKYKCPYLQEGIICSIIGVISSILMLFFEMVYKKKEKVKKG